MIGVGQFDKDGAGPNVCATSTAPDVWNDRRRRSTDRRQARGQLPERQLSVTADDCIKISSKTTIDIKGAAPISRSTELEHQDQLGVTEQL